MNPVDRMVAAFEKRLPRKLMISVPELSLALGVSTETAGAIARSGELPSADLGAAGKEYWQIEREGLVEWYRNRCLGERKQVLSRRPYQPELTDDLSGATRPDDAPR